MSSASTTSLVSTTSRTPLTGAQPKDFQAAFASLQSTYGLSGTTPSPINRNDVKHNVARSSVAPTATTANSAAPKDFQAAFADLQSTYGFAGSVPSPVPKPTKQKQSGSLFSTLFARTAVNPSSASTTTTAAPRTKTKVRAVPRPTQHMTAL